MKNKYKLVYIEWEDAIANSEWKTGDEVRIWTEKSSWLVKQVGWIMYEDEKRLTIAGRMEAGSDFQEPSYGQLQMIPKTWIRKRKTLKI